MNKDNTTFIINDIVKFYPENGVIKKTDTKEEIKLNPSASDCLFLIISNRDEIVSHDVFLKLVWEKNSEFVGLNTLYQNISLIRKSFKQLNFNTDIITTIPKKGFKLSDDIEIKAINQTESNEGNNLNDGLKKANRGIFISKNKKYLFILIPFIFTAILIHFKSENIIESYIEEKDVGKCHVFSRIKKDSRVNLEEIIVSSKVNCAKPKYIYISNKPYSDSYSIIECNNKLNTKEKVFCNAYLHEE